ncbi:MAG: efflux RND transporter periplasmic adaptor subunit [Chloroflexi bacterium]|nr:efflux RND transporter periplasmic adaptor subunit [Chloroflexota bacterium]
MRRSHGMWLPVLVLALAALGLFAAGCTSQASAQQGGPPQARQRPAVPVSIAQVRRGAIDSVLTYSGTIQSGAQVNVVSRSSGVIDQLLVDVGSQVKKGDRLAVLERSTLEAQVRQAEANLANARFRLAAMEKGPKQEDVDAAQAQLEAARIRLKAMRGGGRAEDIASAQAALDAAQAKLAQVQRGPTPSDLQAAQSAVDTAQANLRAVQARLAQVKQGATAADVQAAQSAVESDRAQLASAEAAATNVSGSTAADVRSAEGQVEIDRASLAAAEATLKQLGNPIQADVETARSALATAQSQLETARRQRFIDNDGTKVGGTTSACTKDDGGSRTNSDQCDAILRADEAAAVAAEAAVTAAQEKLDLLTGGGATAPRRSAEAAVVQAQQRLAADQVRLEAIRSGTVSAQKAAAQSALVAAREKLKADQARLDQLKASPTDSDLQAAQTAVDSAQATLRAAQARLEQLQTGPTDEDLTIAQAAVDQASQTLAVRQAPFTEADLQIQEQTVAQLDAQLRSRMAPYSDLDLEQARASMAAAQAALDVARANLDAATVVAPFDGVVTARNLTVGALASPQTPIVSLMSGELELTFNVEERQVARVQPGQSVTLSVPSSPEERFEAKVRGVAPSGDPRNHTFQVKVQPSAPAGKLLPGMFAELRVIAERRENALLIPKDAVVRRVDKASVFVAQDGRAQEVAVKLGLVDDTSYEVLEGLAPDAQVITLGQGVLVDGDAIRPLGAANEGSPGGGARPGQGQFQGKPGQKPEGGQFQGKPGQGQRSGQQGGPQPTAAPAGQ